MLIDWFTVGAQAINFLILVWLLRRYLYKPVLAAIDAREKAIAAKLADAAAQDTKAQAAGEDLRKRAEAFDSERDGLMRKAAGDAKAEQKRLIDSAREEAQLLRVKLAQALTAERGELGRQLMIRTQEEVYVLTRKALSELAGANLDERMIDVLIERLRKLPEQQKVALAGNAQSASAHDAPQADSARVALVRSAHDFTAALRPKLEAALREVLGARTEVHFATASEVVCGLEVSVEGVKFAWSGADYLSTLARDTTAIAAQELAHAAA